FDLVQTVEDRPCAVGCDRQALLNVLDWLVHALNLRARMAYDDYISSERSPRAANGNQPRSDGHSIARRGLRALKMRGATQKYLRESAHICTSCHKMTPLHKNS